MGFLERLNLRIGIPLFAVHLVATDVEIVVGEKLGHLADEIIKKLVDLLVRRVHCRIEDSPPALDSVRPFSAGQLGMADEPRGAVTRHIEFRHHADAAISGVSNQVANLVLRVVEGVGTQFVELWIFPALHAKTLILREVPVKNVHLHGFHAVDVPANDIERNEMACGIDHQTAPRKTRLVLNLERRRGEAAGRDIH